MASPSALRVAVENAHAMVPSVMTIPAAPTRRRGLRPTLSTSAIAIRVVTMLVILVITVISRELDSLKPTEAHSEEE